MLFGAREENHFTGSLLRARVFALVLSLLSLWTAGPGPTLAAKILLVGYLLISLGVLFASLMGVNVILPFWTDLLVLAALLALGPSPVPFWFFLAFVIFGVAGAGHAKGAEIATAAAMLLSAVGWVWCRGFDRREARTALALAAVTFGLGKVMIFFGSRERLHAKRRRFLERLTRLIQFDRGLSDSVQQVLGELALEFDCERTYMVIRDDDLERLFVWRVHPSGGDAPGAETLPISRAASFLADSLETTLCWNNFGEREIAFGWDRRTGQQFPQLHPPSAAAREELDARSVLAATVEEAGGRAAGRILVVNPRDSQGSFSAEDLRWLEQIVGYVSLPLENVFRLRHLRARAVEGERSRISRDLHDGILQTLMSLHIRLDVLRRKMAQSPEQTAEDLASLQQLVMQEGEEFRKFVTDLRPVRVDSADLRELMFGFAERFRNEAGVAVDLFVDDRDLRASDRICRELFQIYRESLNNIKKHANASHVVVKLEQDDSKLLLVVDDNGQGFSFSGRYSSEELDRLRLGPISIKERARSVGGVLTVESNPGHGARLTVEIPLN